MFGFRQKHNKNSDYDRICAMSDAERTAEYLSIAEERWESCWMIQSTPNWKMQAGKDHVEGCVESHNFKEFGNLFRIKGVIDAPPRAVFEQLVHGDNESPAWNPTVLECKTIEKINHNTDIAYNVSREATGGLVSSRDFVNLRHWKERDGVTVSLGWSVPHPKCPPGFNKRVRAENKPSFWTFENVEDEPNKCLFALYTRIDLRGWLPQYLVEQAMVGVLLNYIVYLRTRMEDLKSNKPLKAISSVASVETDPGSEYSVSEDSRSFNKDSLTDEDSIMDFTVSSS